MRNELRHPFVQRSYQSQYEYLLDDLAITSGTRLLDVGSGMGFMKPHVLKRGGSYVGIEPDPSSFSTACALYGRDGYIAGYFPKDVPVGQFDVILVLSCVDEVPDKAAFLAGIRSSLEPRRGICLIAVRNRAFFINQFKTEAVMANRTDRSRISMSDLVDSEWISLIENSGLRICELGKFWRPWLTGFSFVGLKNFLYKLVSMIAPRKYSYMLYYKVMVA